MSSDASGGKDQSGDLLDLAFDSTGLPPPLRPPALSQAQLLAAIELGFSNKYLPTEVTGRVNGNSGGVNYQQNNYTSNYSNSSGGQGQQRYQNQGSGQEYSPDYNNHQQQQHQNSRGNGRQEFYARQNEDEGLLAPLRRPHVNEIPPDVLAVLLKTARFEEILGPLQRQQSQGQPVNNSGNQQDFHYNNQNQDYARMANRNQQADFMPQQQQPPQGNPQQPQRQNNQQQRGQNQASPQPQHGYSSPNNQSRQESGSGEWKPTKKTALSPFAKEFQPQTMPPRTQSHVQTCPDIGMNYSQDEANLAEALAQIQMMGAPPTEFADGPYSGQSSLNDDNTDCILTVVTDSINELSSHPANFNRCAKAIHEVLKNYVADAETLGVVVTLIIEQSISNPNFCYSGARLAQYLNNGGLTAGTTNFKTQFLTRLQEEFTNCVSLMENNSEIFPRCRGILSFFGELYMNIRLVKAGVAQPLDVLGLGVSEMMQKLVKDPTHDNIKCVFQVAKLVGWEIENHGCTKLKEEFEKTMKDLSYISMSDVTLKPQTKLLLDTLFQLRRKDWNRGPVEEEVHSSGASNASSSSLKGTDVYELPESDEDDFDDTCLMIDDEPEEVQKAFEDFLKMSHK